VDFDKTVINAAIEALLENPADTEAAAVIIQFGSTLPDSDRISYESTTITKTSGDSATGHTQEQGNVSVPHDHEEKKEYSRGVSFERAGFYKIWRQNDRIIFQDFWKADITTQGTGEQPPEYSVLYDQADLEYKDLCIEIDKKRFVFGGRWLLGMVLSISIQYWKSLRTGEETYLGYSVKITNIRTP